MWVISLNKEMAIFTSFIMGSILLVSITAAIKRIPTKIHQILKFKG